MNGRTFRYLMHYANFRYYDTTAQRARHPLPASIANDQLHRRQTPLKSEPQLSLDLKLDLLLPLHHLEHRQGKQQQQPETAYCSRPLDHAPGYMLSA